MLRILSLDGGGVRGLSSLLILRDVMGAVQQLSGAASGPLRPCDFFELVVGTGTGGISAILLGRMRLTVDEAIDEYIRLADAVFQSPSWRRLSGLMPNHPLFDGKALEDHLYKTIAHRLGDREALVYDSTDPSRCRTAVLAATSANLDAPPYIFRSYHSYPQFTLVDAVRATSATTGLFPSVSLSHPPIKFIDAGAVGYNNPTEIALSEARDIWPTQPVDLVLSIGTGTQRIVEAGRGGLVKLTQRLIESCEFVHDRVCRRFGPTSYFRFSVDRGLENIGVEEWNEAGDQGRLAGVTSAYLRKAEASRQLTSCAQVLAGVTGNSSCRLQRHLLKVPSFDRAQWSCSRPCPRTPKPRRARE
jgi:hypothetical protein